MDARRPLAEIEDRLFERLARGQLLLLVGAGASRWAKLPSWREAVCALAEDLVPALHEHVPDARECFVPPRPGERVPVEALLRIPEAYRFLRGERRLVERLSAILDTSAIDTARLPLHHAIVRLSSFVPAIYTTNFDDLLERAFAWAGRSVQVVASPEDLKDWRFDESRGRFHARYPIYKLHGTLSRPATLVVAESDFLRRSDLAANPIDLRFCSDVMGREILLVGYGFNDPNLRWIWTKLRDLRVPPVGWFLELRSSVIPLGDEPPRTIPLTRLRAVPPESNVDDGWIFDLQVSLSPDGKSLATHTGSPGDRLERIEDAAVYVVNLRTSAVKKILLPKRPRRSASEQTEPDQKAEQKKSEEKEPAKKEPAG